jgi:hypothetical protein
MELQFCAFFLVLNVRVAQSTATLDCFHLGNSFEGVAGVGVHLCTIKAFLVSVCTILLCNL